MIRSWAIPAAGYILLTGAIGVTARVALRTIAWPELLVWTAVAYVVTAAVCIVLARPPLSFSGGSAMGLLTGFLASTGLICLFLALNRAEVTRVVPVTSSYPVVTLLLSVVLLNESLPPTRVLGTVLVVVGVALTAR